ncbi:MAG: dihydropteroate synthase [Verrucomicrobia bacterium]|nr:dihydropteroate synthase [Verrucomicrobiota bacterium]MCF7708679.1 dihydropteroate synthase [Verrucomicrobiota bacterium]
MGILNVTPDSFFDGGRFTDPEVALERALEMEAEGAGLIDVGGESTRPDSECVDEDEELRRVIPVLEKLSGRVRTPLSIDTRKVGVARRALEAGAVVVNDVGANRDDDAMGELIAETGAGYVVMHMRGTPQTMQRDPVYRDVVGEVSDFFDDRIHRLTRLGVSVDQIILDVGIGFGKTVHHNLELLSALRKFKKAERPLLIGVSRKSFIGRLLNAELDERLAGALACACWAALAGVDIIRAHDVIETLHAVKMIDEIRKVQSV